jgi:hypothetical protein
MPLERVRVLRGIEVERLRDDRGRGCAESEVVGLNLGREFGQQRSRIVERRWYRSRGVTETETETENFGPGAFDWRRRGARERRVEVRLLVVQALQLLRVMEHARVVGLGLLLLAGNVRS